MMKASNQGAVKDGAWLVTPPEGINFTTALTIACRGNEKIANLLNYFLDVAAREAKRQSLDIEKIEYIEINRTLDQIIAALSSHNKAACKKTIHDRMLNLTSLKYIEADSYRYTYRVYFRAIQEAFNNPPPADKPKLRGRHARKEQSQEACQDRNFDLKVKSSIRAENDKNRIAILENEISDLRSRMLDLTSEISDLRSRMLDLTSSLDQERACREALEAKNSSLYIGNTGVNTGSNTVGTYGANAPVVTDQHTPASLFPDELPPLETEPEKPPVSPNGSNGQKPTKPERPAGKEKGKGKGNVTNEPPAKPKTGLDAHTDQERAFWALWLNADQNKKVPPPYKDSASDHIKTLAAQVTSQEQMDSLTKFARKQLSQQLGREVWRVQLGNLRASFPDWDREQQKENKPASPSATPAPEPSQEILWTEEPDHKGDPVTNWYRYHLMPRAEAKEKYKLDYYGELPPGVINEINHKFKLEKLGKITRPDVAIAS